MKRKSFGAAAVAALAMLALFAPSATHGQAQDKAEAALKAAMDKETIDGNLKAAIDEYKKLAQGGNKSVAARALVRLGECYEKQGNAEARQAYQQVVSKFVDQKDAAAQARARLAAMGSASGSGRPTTERVLDDGAARFNSAVSMDRSLVTFNDLETGDLMLSDLGAGTVRNLTRNGPNRKGREFSSTAAISPDGALIVYTWDDRGEGGWSEIRSINSDGTGMRTHARLSLGLKTVLSPAAVSPDKRTAIVTPLIDGPGQMLSLVDNSLKPFAEGVDISDAKFSPDGKAVVLSGNTRTSRGGLFLANADGSGVRLLLADSTRKLSPFWSPDGKWIAFFSNRNGNQAIWAIPSSGGTPRLLKEDQGIGLNGVARDGSLYYTLHVNQHDVQTVQLDLANLAVSGEPTRLVESFSGRNSAPSFSPDGKWAAWVSGPHRDPAAPEWQLSIIVRPAAGGEEKVSPARPPMNRDVVWFPDGKALLSMRGDNGKRVWERVELADGGATEIFRDDPAPFNSLAVAPGGNAILGLRCNGPSPPLACTLVTYDLQARSEKVETLGEIRARGPAAAMGISPDGKWLALMGVPVSGSGRRIFVKPMAGGKLVEVARDTDTEFIGRLAWTPDSKWIIYANTAGFRAVSLDGASSRVIPVKGAEPSIAPDGRLAYTVSSNRSELWVARNLLPSN